MHAVQVIVIQAIGVCRYHLLGSSITRAGIVLVRSSIVLRET